MARINTINNMFHFKSEANNKRARPANTQQRYGGVFCRVQRAKDFKKKLPSTAAAYGTLE
jgi:hypothetical protein